MDDLVFALVSNKNLVSSVSIRLPGIPLKTAVGEARHQDLQHISQFRFLFRMLYLFDGLEKAISVVFLLVAHILSDLVISFHTTWVSVYRIVCVHGLIPFLSDISDFSTYKIAPNGYDFTLPQEWIQGWKKDWMVDWVEV